MKYPDYLPVNELLALKAEIMTEVLFAEEFAVCRGTHIMKDRYVWYILL